jgi:hypothetical protein
MSLRRPAVRPMSVMAVGVLLVAFELRARSLDVLADPAGWLLVAYGAWLLALAGPALAAAVAAAISTADLFMPYHYVYVDPETGAVLSTEPREGLANPDHLLWDRVSGGRAVAMAAAVVIGGLALWWTLGRLSRRADRAAASQPARRLRVLGVAVVLAWVVPYVTVVAMEVVRDGSYDPVWNDGRELVALPGFAAMICLAIALVLHRDAAWAVPPDSARPSPWSRARLVQGRQRSGNGWR